MEECSISIASTLEILESCTKPESKVHGANMGPTWVLSAPDGPHVGPMNLAIREDISMSKSLMARFEWDPLQWCHNGHDSVSNHQPYDSLLNLLFRRRSKKTSKLRVTGLCVGNSPGTGEFPAQMVSNTENVCQCLPHCEPLIHWSLSKACRN